MKYFFPLLIPFIFLFQACQTTSSESEEGCSSTIDVHLVGDPSSLHPFTSRLSNREEIIGYIYEHLLTIDPENGQLIPQLAASLPSLSGDGLTYTFDIQQKAQWPDGTPITAEDVLFSLKALVCPLVDNASFRAYAEFLEDAILFEDQPKRIDLVMSEYYMYNDYFATNFFIIDSRFYDPQNILDNYTLSSLMNDSSLLEDQQLINWATEFNDAKYGRQAELLQNGSGPYYMTEWLPEQSITLRRQDKYWGQNTDGEIFGNASECLHFRIVRDEQAIIEGFRNQQLDLSTKLLTVVYEKLSQDSLTQKYYELVKRDRTTVTMLIMNNQPDGINQLSAFRDKRVRNALNKAIPLDDILYNRLESDGTRVNGPLPKSNPLCHKDLEPVQFNQNEAKSLLTEAGWIDSDGDGIRDKIINGKKTPLSFNLNYDPGDPLIRQLMAFIGEAWNDVGADCELSPESLGSYWPKVKQGQFEVALLALTAPPLPYEFKQLWHSQSGDNFIGFANEQADLMIDSLRVEPNPAKRLKMAERVQEIIFEEQPCLFLFTPTKKMIVHKDFSNRKLYGNPPYVLMHRMKKD